VQRNGTPSANGMPEVAVMENPPKVLVVLGSQECGCLVQNLRELSEVVTATGMDEAMQALRREEFDAVFSAWEIPGGLWSELLTALQSEKMSVPAILYYHCADEREWLQALEAGAFDLLAPPFDKYKLSVVLEHARSSRRRMAAVA
jgi:DNA-binding NtrC family response regulator